MRDCVLATWRKLVVFGLSVIFASFGISVCRVRRPWEQGFFRLSLTLSSSRNHATNTHSPLVQSSVPDAGQQFGWITHPASVVFVGRRMLVGTLLRHH
jgi:hypothetical protein